MGKRILVDVERARYGFSGIGYYCHCLEKGLRELESGEEYDFYRPKQGGGEGHVVAYHGWNRLYNPSPRGYSLLHITNQLNHYFLRHSAVSRKVVTLHDLNFLRENLRPSKRERLLRTARTNLRQADGIVCISEFVRQDFEANRALLELKADVEVRVIHNGLIFPEGLRGICPSAELESAEYLLAIGVLHDKKQQHRLVEMLAHLPQDWKLVLVYSGKHEDYYAKIQGLVAQHGLRERVVFLPNVSHAEKQWLLEHMTALVHPSIAEGFGIPPVEAMHIGKPVFLSQYTSLPEVGGEEAFYFPKEATPEEMANTVLQGLQRQQEDEGKAARMRAWAARYDYRRMAEAYGAFYEELL